MNKSYHKIFIIFSILIILGGVYSYFSDTIVSEASLSSSLVPSISKDSSNSSKTKITLDIAFISTLDSLKQININTTLFMSKAFQSLNNNTVKLEDITSGRVNPFAPITQLIQNTPTISQVTTNKPLEIKNKTAVLNGVVENTTKVTDAYFEYGPTDKLGQKTSPVTVSLIGMFISNITRLKPETNYFYKACAKINDALFCGDIISFNTIK